MGYKLVVLDIDGTMLSSQAELVPEVRQSIARVLAKGVGVTLATGRRACRTMPLAKALGLSLPFVAHNGALIVDPAFGVQWQKGICLQIANELIDELFTHQIPHLVYRGEDQGEMGQLHPQFAGAEKYFRTFIDNELFITRSRGVQVAPLKIAVLGPRYDLEPKLDDWRKKYSGQANMVLYYSRQFIGVDFTAAGCSKAGGIRYILDTLDLDFAQVVAIGDDYNDIELIKSAGLGVAMANAPAQVKKHAQLIAASNDENGVAKILEKLF